MKKTCTNWNRIIAIGGLTLCTTLVSTGFNSYQSIINAILVGGIALFTELKIESEPLIKIQRTVSQALIL
jgi:hypothetical protein